MRHLFLCLFLLTLTNVSIGQLELCTDAELSPTAITIFPSSQTLTIDPSWTSDTDYIPPTVPAGAVTVAYWSFTVNVSGYYTIEFETPAVNTILTDVSIGLSDNSGGSACPMDASLTEVYAGLLMTGTPASGGCSFLTMGTTYTLAFAVGQGNEGDVDVTISSSVGATNDDCATTALDISATAASGVDGTTNCATPDAIDFCALASEDHVVYYTYTVDAGITGNRDVRFTFTTNTNTSGTAASGLFFGLFTDCVGTAYTNNPIVGDDPCDPLSGTVTYECVEPGTTLTIAVGSQATEEGDFNILITEDASGVAVNDDCANASILPAGPSCTDISGNGDNTDGCPEISDLGSSCSFSSDLVVWYELTLPSGATGIDFSALSAGAQMALFENDCPTLTLINDCFTGDTGFTGLTDGGTYLLAVSQTFGAEGPVTFTWVPIAIPTNDDCDLATNPDILLETNGTTGCADHEFNTCGVTNTIDDHQVFYIYSNTSGSTVDLEITIEGDVSNGNPASQVSITALAADCSAFTGFYQGALTNSEWCDILGSRNADLAVY